MEVADTRLYLQGMS